MENLRINFHSPAPTAAPTPIHSHPLGFGHNYFQFSFVFFSTISSTEHVQLMGSLSLYLSFGCVLTNRFPAFGHYRWYLMMILFFVFCLIPTFHFGSTEQSVESCTTTHQFKLRLRPSVRWQIAHRKRKLVEDEYRISQIMAILQSFRDVKSELKALILFPVTTMLVIGTMLQLIVRGVKRMCAISIY